jgi:transcription elongation factor GreB
VTEKVSAAAALGDRSENAEYIYGKKQLREIDSRIRYLTKILDNLIIVDRIPDDLDCIYFGAWVHLKDQEGEEFIYRIIGADEIDLKQGWISVNSPMAKSLLKKRRGDIVTVSRPKGAADMTVIDVRYEPIYL